MKKQEYVLKKGSFVVSVAGHDEGRTYVVTEIVDKDFVRLADGSYHKLINFKRKRIKHIKNTGEVLETFEKQKIDDNSIHAGIIKFLKSGKSKRGEDDGKI